MIEWLSEPVPYWLLLITGITGIILAMTNMYAAYLAAYWRSKAKSDPQPCLEPEANSTDQRGAEESRVA